MLLERRCPSCGSPSRSLCRTCRARLRARRPGADGCDRPGLTEGLDSFVAAFGYDEFIARLVVAAKNRGRRELLSVLGGALAAAPPGGWPPLDVVTWVPASRSRRRGRGYDQGRVLAGHVGRHLGVRRRPLLARSGRSAQAGGTRAQRLAGPALRPVGRAPPSVLVVDDVATTGASLAAAERALRRAGARSVHAAVVAVADRSARSSSPTAR